MGDTRKTVQISETGRINLPAEMRRALGLIGRGQVILTQDADGVRITTLEQSLKRVREIARAYRPSEGRATDELMSERRRESARERHEPDSKRG